AGVVVDRVAPDPGAGHQVVRSRRAVGDARDRRAEGRRGHRLRDLAVVGVVTRPTAIAAALGAGALAAGREALELGLHERVEVAVEDRARVAGLDVRPEVLDHLVGVQDVAPDLVPPAGLDVLAAELPQLGLLL